MRTFCKKTMMLVSSWFLSLFYFACVKCEKENNTFHEVNGTVITNTTFTRGDGPYLVTSNLVIAQNASLTVQAGVEILFLPKAGIRVYGTLYAKGTHSQRISFRAIQCNETKFCNSTNSTEFYVDPGIRLVDGSSYSNGRLEIQWNGQWGTICDRYWDDKDTEVACRHLGFLGAKGHYRHPGSGSIWLRNVGCTGKENSILRCSSAGIGNAWGCGHYQDVGIECDTLLPFLKDNVYWKGIHFTPNNSSDEKSRLYLENVDIVHALVGIKALQKAPELSKVAIQDSGSGLVVKNLKSPLNIVDTTILRCKIGGINVTSSGGPVAIQNVTVQNTSYGDGLVFKYSTNSVDLCSIIPEVASVPLVLNASGNAFCIKIFRAPPGRTLSAHFRTIAGSDFELNITDGSTSNKTLLSRITAYHNGKTIKSGSSSVLEISFFSKGSPRVLTNVEFIIMENEDLPQILKISSSRFLHNTNSGITVHDLIGQTQISSTVVTGSGVGLLMNRTNGGLAVVSTMFLHNLKHGIHTENLTGSVILQSVNSSKNQGSGIVIGQGSVSVLISDCQAEQNSGQGLHIYNQINSTLNISNIEVCISGWNGIYFHDFFEDSYVWLSNLSSTRNTQNGALFERLSAVEFLVSTSLFDGNSIHGSLADKVMADSFSFWRVSTSNNHNSGVFLHRGRSNISLESWSAVGNNKDGFYLDAQEGKLWLKNCFIHRNKQSGLNLFDSSYARLQSSHFHNCSVSENKEYGIKITVYSDFQTKHDNYSITVIYSTIANNSKGAIFVYPMSCSYNYYSFRRHVQLSFIENEVSGNRKDGLYFLGPEEYEFNALIRNNSFTNNTDGALRLAHTCRYSNFPVHVDILSNYFTKNKGEHVILVDYEYLPDRRFAIIKNNTFIENQGLPAFSSRYLRIKTQAVVTLKEGNFTVEGNFFDNPSFAHDMATYLQQHNRIISARENWWGTLDECKIKKRIFDFEDRIDVAKIQYYPFLASFDFRNISFHRGLRLSCFLEGNKLGGILNQSVTLARSNTSYEVTGDVIVLSNGTLTIEGNVTLEFPLQAVFFVQGQVIINGTDNERVKFVPKKPLQNEIRLVDGLGPWEGRLEIWLNNTWMAVCRYYSNYQNYLPLVVCRQLGYEAFTSSYRYANGRESMFLYNVLCLSTENNNVMSCNRDKWKSQATCSHYVFYVQCNSPYWAGVHLAMTAKKSIIKNLDISFAGFAYRNDLGISGSAFRVDLTHHEIVGVFVNNSANVGLQVVYPHAFKLNSPDIQNSTIMNTILDGIQVESPYLNLAKTDIVNTRRRGFQLIEPGWRAINKQALELADPEVKKYINLCSENVTVLGENGLQYYLIASSEKIRNCESVINVPPDYRIGLQLIFHRLGSTFQVESGTNKTSSSPWEINRLQIANRPLWVSNSSSVLFRSSSYYRNYVTEVHFLLYLVQAKENTKLEPPSLVISHSNVMNSAGAGIHLSARTLGHIHIESTNIRDSADSGLGIEYSHITRLNVVSCVLLDNRIGIYFYSSSGNVAIENTKITNSTSDGVTVAPGGWKMLHLINSSITHSKQFGISVHGSYRYLKLLVTRVFFGWNEGPALNVYSAVYSASFNNTTFLFNTGPVVNFQQRSRPTLLILENNVFKNNKEPSVVAMFSYFSDEIFIRKNKFINNICQKKGIIDIGGGINAKELVIEGNLFERNTGRSVLLEGSTYSPVEVVANVFRDNNCSNKGAIEVRRMEKEITITDNIFMNNKGQFMVLLQCIYDITFRMVKQNLTFSNNSLINNTKVPSDVLHCEVNISGLLENKTISMHQNNFKSHEFSKELCVNVLASFHTSILDVSFNSWGYDNIAEIRKRIFDVGANYELVSVHFTPFISTQGTVLEDKNQTVDSSEAFTTEHLGGFISSHVRLKRNHTPYVALSNVIILSKASLTVDPGVEVQFGPGVSILVLGALFAFGSADHPVKFTLLKQSQRDFTIPVRLIGEKYPWLGRLEVAHNGTWAPVCLNKTGSWRLNNAKVICRQLGFDLPSSIRQVLSKEDPLSNRSVWPFNLNCFGNEAEISECPITFEQLRCNSSYYVTLICKGGLPWGNVRFMRDFKNTADSGTSILEHLEIEHCGYRNGGDAPAIQAIYYVPKMNYVHVVNCSSGGLNVLFPEEELSVERSTFINTGGNGTEIIGAERNVTLNNIKSISNKHGVTFSDTDEKRLQGLTYGQIMFCAEQSVVNLTRDELFLFFKVPHIDSTIPSLSCQKVIYTGTDYVLSFKLLVQKNQHLRIYDPSRREILRSYYREELRRLEGHVILPWNHATVTLSGYYDGEVLLQVKRVRMNERTCTFEPYQFACGWQDYFRATIQGIALNRNWFISYNNFAGADHTFSSREGRYMSLGGRYSSGYGALVSPPILKDNNTCFLMFYYKLWKTGGAELSVLMEEFNGSTSTNESLITPLWTTNQTVSSWRKQKLHLPRIYENFSVIFLGNYKYSYYNNYVVLDDVTFIKCNTSRHFIRYKITDSIVSDNLGHGISSTSTETDNHLFQIKRSKIISNGVSPTVDKNSLEGIHLNATNQMFEIVNSYLAENKNGGIYVKLQKQDVPMLLSNENHIHGNIIEYNRGKALFLQGTTGQTLHVKVTGNYFSFNLAKDWQEKVESVCKISDLSVLLQGNFFYNNSGQYILEFNSPQSSLRFLNNTLYRNRGLGDNYGVTVLCNGAAEMHDNVLENPNNRYQISTTLQGSPVTVNATSNWWGEGVLNLVASVIMDNTKDYRLSLTVFFKPFLQFAPQKALSVSCPPEWMIQDEVCYLYKGAAFSFQEAGEYCEKYGGFLINIVTTQNRRLVQRLREEESKLRWTEQVPTFWTPNTYFLSEGKDGMCYVIGDNDEIKESHCDKRHQFVCVRRPVMNCPNSCFHNGECVGAVCFCHRGWTGEDCSKFHCDDLHSCSGSGECVGPNVCKCHAGFMGRGCSYSYCGKFESCTDCVKDPYCGWCDRSRSCLGGFPEGPPKITCPEWFFYHCYTVGDEDHCSNNIQRLDCKGKHCNFQDGKATTESCQKCTDIEKCYKISDQNHCRAWNETRCPGGKVRVDYTDPQRRANVQLAKNVKLVEPNTTIIYTCPLMPDEQEEMSLVFVAPKALNIKVGDILSSPQAGGIMHKILNVVDNGPFKVMLGSTAGLEEVINYADFQQEATLESIEDELTLEDEPDEEDLQDLISGNITVNESRIINFPTGSTIYKCLGHTYEVDNVLVYSYYLVVDKNSTFPNKGDIIVSNTSDGFIETVVAVFKTDDAEYLETKLQQCNKNSQWNRTRLEQRKQQFNMASFCSGGDNNPGLLVSSTEIGAQHITANDSIIGRPSQGFIAKVVKVNSNKDVLLVEVIAAKVNENGTVSTAVEISKLQSHHRRSRRSTEKTKGINLDFINFNEDSGRFKMVSRAGSTVEGRVSVSLRLSLTIEIEKTWYIWKIKDAYVKLELAGNVDITVQFSISAGLSYSDSVSPMPKKQLGKNKYIRLGGIAIPVGIFVELTGKANIAVSGNLRHSFSGGGSINLGGECRWTTKCDSTGDSAYIYTEWSPSKPEIETGAKIDLTAIPRISIKVPVAPKWLGKLMKTSFFSPLRKLVGKVGKYVDLSLSIYASAPLRAGISVTYPSDYCQGSLPAELKGYYGLAGLNYGVAVGFIGKHFGISFPSGFSRMKGSSICFCPVPRNKYCMGPTVRPTKQPIKKPDTDDYKRPGKNSGNKGTQHGFVKIPGPPCGKEPCCAGNRKGPGCTQPDLWPFKGATCSGNGIAQSTSNCGAACRCLGGWRGPFCDRISAAGRGDPHLETLDGVEYDFFGIGEFWACKSQNNDFGLQFRFFYYERASLIGGVAVKAGQSIVTVMTIKTQHPKDLPNVRVDGVLLNVTTNTSSMEINNGSVLLDVQGRFTSEPDENSVVLISLQFKSGVAVTIDVKHSRVMERQFLNVLYSPTAAYKGHTEGLCGFMDNNATNDFMGPDGRLYQDAVHFAESWRIKDCHNESGKRGSWSWSSSNFYHEDVLDLSYTDPLFRPIYSLQGLSPAIIEIATNTCKALGISDKDLQSCIFDVAVTNDTSFTDQESFKQSCPNQCFGKGRCVNGTCQCLEGWSGKSCDQGSCLNCSGAHGKCIKAFCQCELGWEGQNCDRQATCHNVRDCTSPAHGVCKTTDICQCNPGFTGLDCSITPTCHNVSNCTGNGLCVDFDVCKCDKGWSGRNCTHYSCEHLDYCSGRGRCVGFYQCDCDDGWTGASCAFPDCPAVNQCSGKGECVSTNLCRCYPGFIGSNCSETADCTGLANCSEHGVCVTSKILVALCRCYDGFTGPNCSQPTCTSLNNCSGHGACTEAELCKCDRGYNGTDCSNFSCEALNYCSGHGACVGYDVCRCNFSWSGLACNIPDCSAVSNCSSQGNCIGFNTCACYPSFDGPDCNQKAIKNLHAPYFERPFYNANISENAPLGTLILQVRANDSDVGRNGHIFYSMTGDNSVENVFTVDGKSGILYNLVKFDFETLKVFSFNVTIVASDDGLPQKWTSTVVQITVTDENDNCPRFTKSEPENLYFVFSTLKTGAVLTKMSAIDSDSGTNNDITYNVSNNDAFSIDSKSGIISVKTTPTKTVYKLTVTAEDNGTPSCVAKKILTVTIEGLSTSQPKTDPYSSQPTSMMTMSSAETETQSHFSEFTEPTTDPATGVTSARFKSTTRLVSSRFATESTAASRKSRNKNILIGLSAFGGVMALVVVALIIARFVHMQSRLVEVSPDFYPKQTALNVQEQSNINEAFELLDMPGKV